MTWQRSTLTTTGVIALALSVAGLAGLNASSAVADTTSVVSHTAAGTNAEIQRVKRYWTPRRMRQATPLTVTPSPQDLARASRASAAT
jgi:hypothetical protein